MLFFFELTVQIFGVEAAPSIQPVTQGQLRPA
jgi:hypothetical protein